MRIPLRPIATLLLAIGVATCADAPTVGRTGASPARGTLRGRFAIAPVFSQSAQAAFAQREQFAGASFDHVRIVLVRPPADTVKDTTAVFNPDSPPLPLELSVAVTSIGEAFDGELDYTNNGQVVYSGRARFVSHASNEPPPPPQEIVVGYVGPGAEARKITVSPKTLSLVAPATATFTVTATNASDKPVPGTPVSWATSDPSVATITADGVLTTTGKRGTVTVTATSVTGLTDNATVTVTLPPAAIVVVSGDGQTGRVGTTLPQPATVRVTASDGQGAVGVPVTFAAPTGGSVGPATVSTNADGEATTSLTLGTTAGPQSFVAVAGDLTASIAATATVGPASAIIALSGSGQQDTVTKTLKAPFVAKVTDQFGNGVAGATVTWARTAGAGTLAGSTSTTGADGTASMGYTLGATPGTETVTASVAGLTTPATFTATAVTGAASAIAVVSGQGQSGEVLKALDAPFVVKTTDAAGQPVAGVAVTWAATNGSFPALTNGTTTTDATGQASATLTVGSVAGSASATATIGTGASAKSVTFTALVLPGPAARLVFSVGPPATAVAGQVLAPPIQVQVQDAQGNVVPVATAVTIAFGASPGDVSLQGTLTRNSASGVATFNDLAISFAGVGYTLVASAQGLTSATSAAFTITGTVPAGTWTGAVSTDWFTAGNWSGGVPAAGSNVTIPAGTPNQPALSAPTTVNDLTVATGATLTLGASVLTATGNVDASGGVSNGIVSMTGAAKTVRGTLPALTIAGTVTASGSMTVAGTSTIVSGGTLTISGTPVSLGLTSVTGGRLTVAAGAVVTSSTLSVTGATGVLSQTGGNYTVTGPALFDGASTSGLITGGTLVVQNAFAQLSTNSTSSFAPSGTHLTVFNAGAGQPVSFASSAASTFRNLEIDGTTVIIGSAVVATGQLISQAGPPTVQGGGNTLTVAGVDVVAGMILDNTLLVSSGGTITQFDNVTFQNYAASATPLTISHPGAATPFTFNNTKFLVTPTSGRYLSVTDQTPADASVLTITLLNSTPSDGSAQTATAGGALVNWSVAGATIAWTNAAGGSWSLPSNWSLGRVPTSSDSVVIALAGTYTVTLDTTFIAKYITLGAASGAQTLLLPSRTLTINTALTVLANGVMNPTNGTLAGAGTVDNRGTLVLLSSTVSAPLSNQGTLIVEGNGDIAGTLATTAGSTLRMLGDNIGGTSTLTTTNGFTNNGAIELTSAAGAFGANLIVNGGPLTNAPTGTISSLAGAAGPRLLNASLVNQGLFTIDQPITMSLSAAVSTNSGTVDLAGGDLTVSQFGAAASFTNTGSVTIGAGRSWTINGGTLNLSGGTVSGAGTLVLSNLVANFTTSVTTATTALVATGATINGPGTLTNAPGKTLTLTSTTIVAPLTNQGTLVVQGGNSFNGAVATAQGSTLQIVGNNIGGTAVLTVASGFTNSGAIDLTSANGAFGANLFVNSGVLTNAPTGTITASAGAAGPRALNAQLDNQGSFTIAQTVTMSMSSAVITNSGTIDLNGGDLTISQFGPTPSVTNTGTVTIGAGQTWTVSSGTLNLTSGTVGGAGTLNLISSVVANFAAGFTNAVTALVASNSTINGPGALTNASTKTLTLTSVALNTPLTNQGTLIAQGSSTFGGAVSNAQGATLQVLGNNVGGTSVLTVANGFTNDGAIELTSANGAFGAELFVTNGTLVNSSTGAISSQAGAAGPRLINAQLDNQGSFTVSQALTMGRASSAITNSGTIDLNGGDLTVTQSGTTPSFTNSGTVTIGAGLTWTVNGGTLNLGTGTVSGAGTLNVANVPAANFTAGFTNAVTTLVVSNSTVNGPGILTNAPSRTLTLTGVTVNAPVANQGTLIVQGSNTFNGALTTAASTTIQVIGNNVGGTSVMTVANGFTNDGAIDLTSASGAFGANLFVTAGTLINSSTGTITSVVGASGSRALNAQLDNQGQFIVNQALTMGRSSSAISNSGTIAVNAGLTVNQALTSPSFTNTGTVNIAAGQTWTVNGGTLNLTSGAVTGAGTLSLLSVTAANLTTAFTNTTTSLVASNTTINGPGLLTNDVNRTMTFTNVTLNAPLDNRGTMIAQATNAMNASVTTEAGSTLQIIGNSSGGTSSLSVTTGLTNVGAIELTSASGAFGANLTVTGGPLTNASTGTITSLAGAAGARALNASLDNQGVFTIGQALTMNQPNAVITNSGTIDVSGGDLTVTQSGAGASFTTTGPVTIATGRTWTVNNGTLNVSGGTVTGGGTLTLQSATANFSAGFTNAATALVVSNSTINGPGTLTNAPGKTLTLTNSIVGAPLDNQGTLVVQGPVTLNDTLTTNAASIIQITGNGTGGTATLATAKGFINNAAIDLTSANGAFGANLTVSGGTLINVSTGTITSSAGAAGARAINASLDNQGVFTIGQALTMNQSGMTITNSGTIDVSGGDLTVSQTASSFTNAGVITAAAGRTLVLTGSGTFTQQAAGSFNGGGAFSMGGGTATFSPAISGLSGMTLTNVTSTFSTSFSTTGLALTIAGGQVNGAVTITNVPGQTLTLRGANVSAQTTITNQGTALAEGATNIAGPFNNPSGATLQVQGDNTGGSATLTFTGGAFVNDGAVELTSTDGAFSATLIGTVTNNGTLTSVVGAGGARSISGSLNNTSTGSITIASGGTGTLDILSLGNFTNTGTVNIKLNGTGGGAFDVLNVSTAATLGGTLNVTLVAGFTPATGDTFNVLSYGSRSGTFATVNLPAGWPGTALTYGPVGAPGAATLTAP